MNLKIFGREIFIKKTTLIVIGALLAVAVAIFGYIIKNDNGLVFENNDTNANIVSTPSVWPGNSQSPTENNHEDEIKVYITGCVKNPGLITIKKGQVVDDAIKAAGGPTADADLNFNLAYVLEENVWIIVKSKKETSGVAVNKPVVSQGSNNNKQNTGKPNAANTGIEIRKDSGGVVVSGGNSNNSGTKEKININSATAAELDSLPGVGEKIAADIVAYRQKNGKFKTIADIEKVPGIGPSKFGKIKDLITVD